nr:hypothetical protein CFP56_21265 [Quercus suber]
MLWGTVRPDKSLGTERCDNVKRKPAAEETTMAPHVEVFDASRLDHAIQYKPNGRRHRPNIDLKACALKELLQYECDLNGPRHDPRTKVVCEPVLRLFRQCANGLTVETTAWEDVHDGTRDETVEKA